jgi:hypothetical protein
MENSEEKKMPIVYGARLIAKGDITPCHLGVK